MQKKTSTISTRILEQKPAPTTKRFCHDMLDYPIYKPSGDHEPGYQRATIQPYTTLHRQQQGLDDRFRTSTSKRLKSRIQKNTHTHTQSPKCQSA